MFRQVGLWDVVADAANSSDPNRAILELARKAEPVNPLTTDNGHVTLVAWVVLLVNLDAISMFNFSMSELLTRVAQGDDQTLFRAVYLDASALHAQPVANRISSASLLDDRSFFDKLAKAITRTKPTRPKPHFDGVRVLMNVLEDAGQLPTMTDAELTECNGAVSV